MVEVVLITIFFITDPAFSYSPPYSDELILFLGIYYLVLYALATITLVGGILLLKDRQGSVMVIVGGGLLLVVSIFNLRYNSSHWPSDIFILLDVLFTSILVISGIVGLFTYPDLLTPKGDYLENLILEQNKEISKIFNISKLRYFGPYLDGLGILVKFRNDTNTADILELINYLQTEIYEKVVLLSKIGPDRKIAPSNKFFVYSLSHNIIQCDEKEIEMK